MATSERLIDAAEPIARAIKSSADIRRDRLVDRAIDPQGRPVLDDRDFLELTSPDGTVWRIRVDNSGNLTTTQVT